MPARKAPKTEAEPAGLGTPEERFVHEYMIDRDPVNAAIRAGVASINIKSKVKLWMGNSEIRRAIQARTDVADIDTMVTPQRIMAGFLEVAFDRFAPSGARNSALKELATLKKMYPDKVDPKDAKRKSNVMLVPAWSSLENWEKAAQAAQAKLKEDVRD